MSEKRIKKISALANTKYLSLYRADYTNRNGNLSNWTIASRKDITTLKDYYFNDKEDKVDAAVIFAFHKETKKVICIKEFRVPLNDYIYELPAGLIDEGEDFRAAAKRELKEETGLDLIKINEKRTKRQLYASPGMTDESSALVFCTCSGKLSTDYLEEEEDIKALMLSQDEIRELIDRNDIKLDARAYALLQLFAEIGEKLFE
ncbi:MAG: NUDIX hydrolase [Clostridium sp.]|nr:NUDIX hydrolase [Clostridium sp.]